MIGPLDWSSPWLAPLRAIGEPAEERIQQGQRVASALRGPFVPVSACPTGEAYEAFIARSGSVPTRDNLHDFLNGLIWHSQPALKVRMNLLQAQDIATRGISPRRGALRDALTLFDENGAILELPDALAGALKRRDWSTLFNARRELWREAHITVVGHALLEQLCMTPRKGLTAHVLLADPLRLSAEDWAAKPFLALPVLGIPGWWPANVDPGFYADRSVFRPLNPAPKP